MGPEDQQRLVRISFLNVPSFCVRRWAERKIGTHEFVRTLLSAARSPPSSTLRSGEPPIDVHLPELTPWGWKSNAIEAAVRSHPLGPALPASTAPSSLDRPATELTSTQRDDLRGRGRSLAGGTRDRRRDGGGRRDRVC